MNKGMVSYIIIVALIIGFVLGYVIFAKIYPSFSFNVESYIYGKFDGQSKFIDVKKIAPEIISREDCIEVFIKEEGIYSRIQFGADYYCELIGAYGVDDLMGGEEKVLQTWARCKCYYK